MGRLLLRASSCRQSLSLLGSLGDLKDLVRWQIQGERAEHRPHLASGWRADVCGTTLLDVLAGRKVLRVEDPRSEVPVSVVRLSGEP